MKLTIVEIAQFEADAKRVQVYMAQTKQIIDNETSCAVRRIGNLAHRMMGAEATLKVS